MVALGLVGATAQLFWLAPDPLRIGLITALLGIPAALGWEKKKADTE